MLSIGLAGRSPFCRVVGLIILSPGAGQYARQVNLKSIFEKIECLVRPEYCRAKLLLPAELGLDCRDHRATGYDFEGYFAALCEGCPVQMPLVARPGRLCRSTRAAAAFFPS